MISPGVLLMRRSVALVIIVVILILALGVVLTVRLLNRVHINGKSSPARETYVVDLMYSNASFSLIGQRGPTLAYPIAEIYTPTNSLMMSTFLWNMASSEGVVNMTFVNHSLIVTVSLRDFIKIQKNIPVDGYPCLMYGRENWFPFYSSTIETPQLVLPERLVSLPNFWSEVDFEVYNINGSIDDFSYDIWLSQNPNTTYLGYPDIEVMVWMYHEENISSPYFLRVGDLTVPALVNGAWENITFIVYVLSHTGSPNGWVGVYYVSGEQLVGNVSLPLSYLIIQSINFADKVFPNLSPTQYYLDAIQVGMEFNNNPEGYADLGYRLYGWYLYFNSQP